MRSDPRCPACDGKVSATAQWCMHCGRDFEQPVDAGARETDRRDGPADPDGDGLFDLGSSADHDAAGGPFAPPPDETGAGGGPGTGGETTVQRERERGGESAGDTVGGSAGAVETNVETDIADTSGGEAGVTSEDPTGVSRSAGTTLSGAGLARAVAGYTVDWLENNDTNLAMVVYGVPALAWFYTASTWSEWFGSAAGVASVVAALLLALLYSRESAKETLAAALYGSGLVFALVPVVVAVGAYLSGAVSALSTALPGLAWFLLAVGLLGAGAWLHGQEF
jgi:hypothetical protein